MMMGTPRKFYHPPNSRRKQTWKEEPPSRRKDQKEGATISRRPEPKANLPSDVILVSNDGKEFPSRRSTLSDASSYFRAMFGGAFRETSSDKIVLHSIHGRTLKIVMDHINRYQLEVHQELENPARPIVADVFRASHMLDLPGLLALSCALLGNIITDGNYREIWEFYDMCRSDILSYHLCTSFRRIYRHFLRDGYFLTFDPPFMSFVFGLWTPFVNQKWMVEIMLRWIKHDPERRENCLSELANKLRVARLPPNYVGNLAFDEEILQRHPEVLERFQTSEEVIVVEKVQRVGYEAIADSVSVLVFSASSDHGTTVQRIDFSGRIEEKVLPFKIRPVSRIVPKRYYFFACLQYKRKIFFVGRVVTFDRIAFIEYDFESNSFVDLDSAPIPALRYCDAFVIARLYVHCMDLGDPGFVQCYDFRAGGKWTHVLSFPVYVNLCPYENSFLVLQSDRGNPDVTRAISPKSKETGGSFTVPCKFDDDDVVIHYDGRLWGFSDRVHKQFVYEVGEKRFESKYEHCGERSKFTHFQRVQLLRHPLVVKWERDTVTLSDFEDCVELGQVAVKNCVDRLATVPFCRDLTL